jgi:hypothetical protein
MFIGSPDSWLPSTNCKSTGDHRESCSGNEKGWLLQHKNDGITQEKTPKTRETKKK